MKETSAVMRVSYKVYAYPIGFDYFISKFTKTAPKVITIFRRVPVLLLESALRFFLSSINQWTCCLRES